MTDIVPGDDEALLSLFTVALGKVRDQNEQATPVTLSSRLREDLGLDSFAALELLFEIEDQVGIRIPQESAMSFQTVADVVAFARDARTISDEQRNVTQATP